ncbi:MULTISPECIES: hypothetical protein [Neisseria]|nr:MULTISPECIES: hypothetical protein [Neisseria]
MTVSDGLQTHEDSFAFNNRRNAQTNPAGRLKALKKQARLL